MSSAALVKLLNAYTATKVPVSNVKIVYIGADSPLTIRSLD